MHRRFLPFFFVSRPRPLACSHVVPLSPQKKKKKPLFPKKPFPQRRRAPRRPRGRDGRAPLRPHPAVQGISARRQGHAGGPRAASSFPTPGGGGRRQRWRRRWRRREKELWRRRGRGGGRRRRRPRRGPRGRRLPLLQIAAEREGRWSRRRRGRFCFRCHQRAPLFPFLFFVAPRARRGALSGG